MTPGYVYIGLICISPVFKFILFYLLEILLDALEPGVDTKLSFILSNCCTVLLLSAITYCYYFCFYV